MLGSIRWNIAFGITGFLLTFIFSFGSNGLAITLLRSFYALLTFFSIAFMFRFVLYRINASVQRQALEDPQQQVQAGIELDLVTPDDKDVLNRMLLDQMQTGKPHESAPQHLSFQPLSPPKLISSKDKSAEDLAQAVRHLAEQKVL